MPKKTDKKEKRKNKRLKQETKAMISFAALLLCSLATVLFSQLYFYMAMNKSDRRVILSGIFIGDTEVSGLTASKAKKKAEEALFRRTGREIRLVAGDGKEAVITLSELQPEIKDLDAIVKEAVDYGKSGSPSERYRMLKLAQKGKINQVFPVTYEIKEEKAKEPINKAFKEMLTGPVNAYLKLNEDKTVSVIEEQSGETIDIPETVKALNALFGDNIDNPAETAEVFLKKSPAKVTAEMLKDLTDILGEFSTYYGADGSGRAQNIEIGTRRISDVFLNPREEYSVQRLMGPTTQENGFAEANSFEGDEIVTSFGGGICQVSSTLYNAVLMAELEVTERSSHSLRVSYVDLSKDAAIADGLLDFKFVNNKDTPVYVQGILSEGNVSFYIYGKETRDPKRTVKYETEITEEKMPEEKKFKESDEPIGKIYTEGGPSPETYAQLVKIVYEDGEEISRGVENYSHYLASKEVVKVGIKSDDPDKTEAMKKAIETDRKSVV